ncbi:MAG: purine permease [Armatimonadetes bacterium]|nr:purine permease [Armatimonadota bacterium]
MEKRFYGLEEPIPVSTAMMLGLQHVLAMFVGIVTPPLLVSSALELSLEDTAYLVSMSLFTSGITTYVQVHRFGPVGSGMLTVTGPSFVFVPLAIQTGAAGGLPLIFGSSLLGSVIPILVSRWLTLARRLFPPLVTGTVVMLIGFSLVQVGFAEMAGGFGAPDFGSAANLSLGLLVALTIVILQRVAGGYVRTISIAVGLAVGYFAALAAGLVDLGPVGEAGWFHAPRPLHYGMTFNALYLVPWLVGYMAVALECIGDLTATSQVSREPVEGPIFLARLKGGLLSDGLGCAFTSLFNAMPKTTFAQNNGIIALTGVASRRAGVAAAALLVLLGLFPKLSALVSVVPRPVIGGATVLMFAMVAVAGLNIVISDGFTARNQFILAVALAFGMGVEMVPQAVAHLVPESADGWLPVSLRILLESGLAIGALTAMVLNLVLDEEPQQPTVPG